MAIASVTKLLAPSAASILDTAEFRVIIEDFLELLKVDISTEMKPIPSYVYFKSRFDWIGLLNDLGIHKDIHWTTIRMNGGMSYTDVPKDLSMILVPSVDKITQMASIMNTRKRI